MANPHNAVVDLTTPPTSSTPLPDANPLSSLSNLGSTLDTYSTDIPGFINDLLSPHLPSSAPGAPKRRPDLEPIDKTLNDLLTKLSLLSQDTSSALEQSIHDISRTVPRLTYDLQFMRESATSLQTSLSSVQSQVRNNATTDPDSDEAKTYTSLEKLTHLDKLKTRMESARDILREAESWSTLESEIMAFIEGRAWLRAGSRLAEAGKSMVVFQSTPGEYDSRRTLLVSLQNELETALAKALEASLKETDAEGVGRLREVFELIERGDEFKEYYFKARRKEIVEEWNQAVILDTITTSVAAINEEKTAVKFNVFLPHFYTTLIGALQMERTRIAAIFPPTSTAHNLTTFLQSTLDSLEPSMQSRLGSLADHHGASALPELIKAYRTTEELALGVQGILDDIAFNSQGGIVSGSAMTSSPTIASPTSAVNDKTPRSAHRKSISRRFSRAPATQSDVPSLISPLEWETTLYEPFLDLQGTYPSLERRYLSNLLRTEPSLSSVSTKGDASRALLDRATAAFGIADEAITRCLALTHGYGAKGLVDALGGFFEDFMESQRDRVLAPTRSKSGGKKDELDFEGLDYSSEDWEAFQLGLHVLTACREIKDRLSKFDERLRSALGEVEQISRIQPNNPSTFRLQETTLGSVTLLQQSPLNSAEFHSLLETAGTTTLVPAQEALVAFTKEAQRFLQGIILSPLQAQLQSYPSLSVWAQPDKAVKRGDLQVPTFSLSPTDTIARVSEGLLNLLRVFEVYAADDSLAFSIATLPFVDADLLAEASKTSGLGAETVLSTWVSSLSLSLLAQLTKSTLPRIRSLTSGGASQLASDLDYLSNAVRALDVEWEDLERWKEAAGVVTEEDWKKRYKEALESNDGEDVWRKVGGLRGWL